MLVLRFERIFTKNNKRKNELEEKRFFFFLMRSVMKAISNAYFEYIMELNSQYCKEKVQCNEKHTRNQSSK